MNELEAQLKELEIEQKLRREGIENLKKWEVIGQKKINDLKKELAEPVTYSIGDRFEDNNSEWMIAKTGDNNVSMISLRGGHRWGAISVSVIDTRHITPAEMKLLGIYRLTRTYDHRKQCKVNG